MWGRGAAHSRPELVNPTEMLLHVSRSQRRGAASLGPESPTSLWAAGAVASPWGDRGAALGAPQPAP